MSVANSEDALASAVRRMPRIIVASFDSQTREDRFTLCVRLKADERLQSVPVLLTSMDLDDGDLRRATDLRLLAIATSPGDCGKVLGAVGGMLSVGRPQRRKVDGREPRSAAMNALPQESSVLATPTRIVCGRCQVARSQVVMARARHVAGRAGSEWACPVCQAVWVFVSLPPTEAVDAPPPPLVCPCPLGGPLQLAREAGLQRRWVWVCAGCGAGHALGRASSE